MAGESVVAGRWNIDGDGFLVDPTTWDEDFARHMAPRAGIKGDLTTEHLAVIRCIRNTFETTGRCPLIYQTCRDCGMHLEDLERLFPAGYLRGACRLAGLTFKEGYLDHPWHRLSLTDATAALSDRTYRIDVRGFLVDPSEWDEPFALTRAQEMKIPGGLTERHWQVIKFLRQEWERYGTVPTVYATCRANDLTLDDLERLFPDGYHRSAVKLAGLRMR
jgi:tRNA 2-thiouridine synthesizing protein E